MLEAFRIAVRYMTPVVVLSDGYVANSSEPWLIPDVAALPRTRVEYRTEPEGFQPYQRDPETFARPWAIPGTPGLEHRIGGLETEELTGNVSYRPLQPRAHGGAARREGGAHRAGPAAGRGERRAVGRAAGGGLGRHLRRHHLGGERGARGRAATCRASTCAT